MWQGSIYPKNQRLKKLMLVMMHCDNNMIRYFLVAFLMNFIHVTLSRVLALLPINNDLSQDLGSLPQSRNRGKQTISRGKGFSFQNITLNTASTTQTTLRTAKSFFEQADLSFKSKMSWIQNCGFNYFVSVSHIQTTWWAVKSISASKVSQKTCSMYFLNYRLLIKNFFKMIN